ncbi:MAG TPA: hypothetical protein PKK10_06550 [Woeseiaceae bacterium]|nr:hypothetical protein [Woeseiaceae bacterium]
MIRKAHALKFSQFLLTALSVGGLLAACDVQTYDDAVAEFNGGSAPPPPPPPPPGTFGPNFSEIQASVFTPDCATSNCHAGANPPAGLNLEAANSYAMLVGMASSQDSGTQRVMAGNANMSYLVQKLEGTASSGGQMPPTGALPQSEIDVIRQWITAGAVDDRAQAAAPVRVSSMSPAPGASLATKPMQVIAGFDRDLDSSTVNALTFTLSGSGGDGIFGNGNDTQIAAASVSVPMSNAASAVLDLVGVTLLNDDYQVRLSGSGASLIMDLDANALDGEFSGGFPSGDGTAGGDFVSSFTLTALGPTLDQIQDVVFTPICSGCHSGGNPPAGLSLADADTSYAALVNMPSSQNAGLMRVAPNNPDNSYLIHKLENEANIVGGAMPPSGMLQQSTIDEIRQWISDGALRQ